MPKKGIETNVYAKKAESNPFLGSTAYIFLNCYHIYVCICWKKEVKNAHFPLIRERDGAAWGRQKGASKIWKIVFNKTANKSEYARSSSSSSMPDTQDSIWKTIFLPVENSEQKDAERLQWCKLERRHCTQRQKKQFQIQGLMFEFRSLPFCHFASSSTDFCRRFCRRLPSNPPSIQYYIIYTISLR